MIGQDEDMAESVTLRTFTYSLGGHYHINKQLKLTSHFGVAWRAPHVYELYSNGNELSSGIFCERRFNPPFRAELQVD